MARILAKHQKNDQKKDQKINLRQCSKSYLSSIYIFVTGTYRMFNIFEQTVVFFGEPKLGLWRIQENGFIREYRRYAKNGLRETADPNDPNLPWSDFEVIKNNYASYMPADNTLYKYPDDETWNGYFQYLDLSIYHPKYEGKYDNHVPIDLPHFYVTISQVAGQRK